MRHRKKGRKLGRNHHQRQALLKSLAKAVFTHGQIKTTLAKARAVLPLVEKMATKAKAGDLAARRFLFKYFQDQHRVNLVVAAIQKAFPDSTSNFTKTVKLRRRLGDDALIVRFGFQKPVDFSPPQKQAKVKPKSKNVE